MLIELRESIMWGLVNPLNSEEVLLWLTSENPSAEVDFDKMPKWAKHVLKISSKSRYIKTTPELKEDEPETDKKKVKKKAKKKVAKKTTRRSKK